MKFKTTEELKNDMGKLYCNPDCAFHFGIDIAFESFAERVDTYKKYRDNHNKFIKDFKDIAKKYNINLWSYHSERIEQQGSKWRDWLFDYCFMDCDKMKKNLNKKIIEYEEAEGFDLCCPFI